MKILAIIPARKNSRRIKFKNKKKLGHKTLIEYSIDVAKKIKHFNNILVTTDDEDIINICKKKNILAPWIRPKNLSGPNASSYETVKHALKWYEKNVEKIDLVFLLQPTSPFRTKKNILDSLKFLKLLNYKNSIVSASLRQLKDRNKKLLNIFKPNGSIFIIKKKDLYMYESFVNIKSIPFIINDKKESLDIDYQNDWIKAKKYINKS